MGNPVKIYHLRNGYVVNKRYKPLSCNNLCQANCLQLGLSKIAKRLTRVTAEGSID